MPGYKDLTRELCAFPTGITAEGNEPLLARIGRELPLTIRRWPSGERFNGWEVPELWRVERAEIRKDGRLIYDGRSHPFGVASSSCSFRGRVSLEELRRHVFTSKRLDDAIIWHCAWAYKPWVREWGFCMPRRLAESLEPGDYDIDLSTSFRPGLMPVAEHVRPGASKKTVVFQSHICHPHQANDGHAGTVLLLRLFQWLNERPTRYTYKLVLAPEHLGTVFYLRDHTPQELANYVCGVFPEMLGRPGPITVASTFTGDHLIDRIFRHLCRHEVRGARLVPFRRSAGNDETVWEAPGYEVPFLQLNRSNAYGDHYPEYHSSADTADTLQEELQDECLDLLQKAVRILEENVRARRTFTGLIALSNPAYDLYVNRLDPAVTSGDVNEQSERWGYFQDCVVRYLDGSMTVLDMADRHDLPFFAVRDYLSRFRAKGLVDFEHPVTGPEAS